MAEIQALIPPALDRLVRACLAKNSDDRWQSAGDLARELKWIAESGVAILSEEAGAPAPRGAVARMAWMLAAAAILAALCISWIHFRERLPEQQSIRFTIPTEARLASEVRISPDGRRLAFVGQNAEGKIVLWVRPLEVCTHKRCRARKAPSIPSGRRTAVRSAISSGRRS